MTGAFDDCQLGAWPRSRQFPGGVQAAHVHAALDQHAGNAGQTVRVGEQLAVVQPGTVGEVMGAQAGSGQQQVRWPRAVGAGVAIRVQGGGALGGGAGEDDKQDAGQLGGRGFLVQYEQAEEHGDGGFESHQGPERGGRHVAQREHLEGVRQDGEQEGQPGRAARTSAVR